MTIIAERRAGDRTVLAEAGVARTDVTAVVVTHLHTDHIGWAVVDGTRRSRPRGTSSSEPSSTPCGSTTLGWRTP